MPKNRKLNTELVQDPAVRDLFNEMNRRFKVLEQKNDTPTVIVSSQHCGVDTGNGGAGNGYGPVSILLEVLHKFTITVNTNGHQYVELFFDQIADPGLGAPRIYVGKTLPVAGGQYDASAIIGFRRNGLEIKAFNPRHYADPAFNGYTLHSYPPGCFSCYDYPPSGSNTYQVWAYLSTITDVLLFSYITFNALVVK